MKIGIITEHNVLNYGSVLQAYALQRKIELLGHEAEIIDYHHQKKTDNHSFAAQCQAWLRDMLTGFSNRRKLREFERFRRDVLKCSPKVLTSDSITSDCPKYDIYCTGSDQVWKPKDGKVDTNFLLSFAPSGSVKISYAASYTIDSIPSELHATYRHYLSQYDKITVREQSGVRLTKELSSKDADLVCDPTLLLSRSEWTSFASENTFGLKKEKYILVYLLGYMFNMRPDVYSIIDKVQEELGYKVVYLNGSRYEMKRKKSKVLRGLSPEEFVGLFKNAAFVITDSFHGSAFATIFNKPLLGVVRDFETSDSRIISLLHSVGANKSVISYTDVPTFAHNGLDAYTRESSLYQAFIEKSNHILIDTLKTE